jgi:hypothetical protein
MQYLVLVLAIAVAFYIERQLIPLVSSQRLKIVFRWNYINGLMLALASLHPWLKWAQIAFTLCMCMWAFCFSRECLRVEEEAARQRPIIQEREEAERLKRHEEEMRRWAEEERVRMVEHLAEEGCPRGYSCQLMGADGEGGCENFLVCKGA